jgi:hypothetical protein
MPKLILSYDGDPHTRRALWDKEREDHAYSVITALWNTYGPHDKYAYSKFHIENMNMKNTRSRIFFETLALRRRYDRTSRNDSRKFDTLVVRLLAAILKPADYRVEDPEDPYLIEPQLHQIDHRSSHKIISDKLLIEQEITKLTGPGKLLRNALTEIGDFSPD